MVLGWVFVRFLVKTRERISSVWGPEILIIPIAPPGAVAKAQIVIRSYKMPRLHQSYSVENLFDQGIDGVLVLCVHLLGVTVGDDHTTGHGAMAKERSETSYS